MKFTFNLRLDLTKGEVAEKLVIASNHGELTWHVALKLLGYVLFFEERPRIEESAGWHYKPDLFQRDAEGRVSLWIDCGNIAVKKIDKVATKLGGEGRFYILRRTRADAERLRDAIDGRVKHAARVRIVSFADGFVDALAAWLDGTNDLGIRRGAAVLELSGKNRRGPFDRASPIEEIIRS